jgi:NADPH:quinone reductase-like Zn-dependent oxidoreductase
LGRRGVLTVLAARLHGFGDAADVLRVEAWEPGEPGEGQLLLEMLAAPINPADLNVIEGKYGELPELPAIIGNEGSGRVIAVGEEVENFKPGDLVAVLKRGTWCQRMIVNAADAVLLPEGTDPSQGSMLAVNPTSAFAMISDIVPLEPGDWIVQNASNSAVGLSVIQLAKILGYRTLNVVRRAELVPELKALGADVVVTEDCDLRSEAGVLCEGKKPRLALNAVGGASALNLANALEDGGTLVTYGAMGRQPLKLPNGLLIFQNLVFRGFWLLKWKQQVSAGRLQEVMAFLAKAVGEGALKLPVQSTHLLSSVHEAVKEAAGDKRRGKVLLDLTA